MNEQTDNRRTPRKRWIVLGALGLAALALLGFLILKKETTKTQADKMLEQIRAAGDPTTMTELAAEYNRFRTSTNSATAYEELFRMLPSVSVEPKTFGLPGKGWPSASAEIPEAALGAMRGFVATNTLVYDQLADATRQGVAVRDLDFAAGPNMLLPHLAKVKQAAQMLQVRAFVQIADGDRAGAVDTVVQLLDLQRSLQAEPLLFTHLVRSAMYQMGLQAMERLIVQHELQALDVEALENALQRAPGPLDLHRSLKGERAFGLSIFENPASMGPGNKSLNHLKSLPSWQADRLRYLTYLTACVNLATNEFPGALAEVGRMEEEVTARQASYRSSPLKAIFSVIWKSTPLTDMLLPAFFNVYNRQAETIAQTRLALIALALEKKGGGYSPESMRDLDFIAPSDLLDPFTGKPFIMLKLGEGLLLYSVGADGKDHQGTRLGETIERQLAADFASLDPNSNGGSNTTGPRQAKAGETDIVFQVR